MIFSVPILIILLNTNCRSRYSVTNTKCYPNIICHSLYFFFQGIAQCCNYYHLPSNYSFNFGSSMTTFPSQVVDNINQGFGQWMTSSIIHDNIHKLSHKKCHPKVQRPVYDDLAYDEGPHLHCLEPTHNSWVLDPSQVKAELITLRKATWQPP